MARIAAILLLVSLSIAISDVAAYRPLTTTPWDKVDSASARAPVSVSYISSTPEASPTPAPGPSSIDTSFLIDELDSAIKYTRMFLSDVVDKQLYDLETDESKKVCLDVCQQMYGNAISAMSKGMDDLQKSNFVEFNDDLGAFANNVHNCVECFDGKAPREFIQFDTYAKELLSDKLNMENAKELLSDKLNMEIFILV